MSFQDGSPTAKSMPITSLLPSNCLRMARIKSDVRPKLAGNVPLCAWLNSPPQGHRGDAAARGR